VVFEPDFAKVKVAVLVFNNTFCNFTGKIVSDGMMLYAAIAAFNNQRLISKAPS